MEGKKMNSVDAKQFLIGRVIEEAELEKVHLSDVEKKMLHFSEAYPSLPDIYEINAEFERHYDADEYEAKVADLLKSARDRDSRSSPGREREWKDALDALKNEDHYILVMVRQAFGAGSTASAGNRLRDFLIYVAVGVGLVLTLILISMWRTGH
jgi:hypothetical protein